MGHRRPADDDELVLFRIGRRRTTHPRLDRGMPCHGISRHGQPGGKTILVWCQSDLRHSLGAGAGSVALMILRPCPRGAAVRHRVCSVTFVMLVTSRAVLAAVVVPPIPFLIMPATIAGVLVGSGIRSPVVAAVLSAFAVGPPAPIVAVGGRCGGDRSGRRRIGPAPARRHRAKEKNSE
jgi:hypothetical protein